MQGIYIMGGIEMKFYIASKLENYEQVKYLSNKLKSVGWIHTYDWTVHRSVKESGIEKLKEVVSNCQIILTSHYGFHYNN